MTTAPLLRGAALGFALVEAVTAQARPTLPDDMRAASLNLPQPDADPYATGRDLMAKGDVPGAMAAFRQALAQDPRSLDAMNALGVCYDRLGRHDLARSWYDAALAVSPDAGLVLNNVGWSLYLQGEYRAAIPVLRQALADADPQVQANSQRTLNLIAARLAEAAATPAAPRARIVLAADGEQRLELGARAAAPELVASLGEDAVLTIVPTEAAPVRHAAVEVEVAVASVRPAGDGAYDLAFANVPAMPVLAAPAATAVVLAAPVMAPGPATVFARAAAARQDLLQARVALPARLPVSGPGRLLAAVSLVQAIGRADPSASRIDRLGDGPPAWLIASRRAPRQAPGTPHSRSEAGTAPAIAFDSDDAMLNLLAARHRGAAPDRHLLATAWRAEAVARLEALVRAARARRA